MTIKLNGKAVGKSCDATVGERMNFSFVCTGGVLADPRWHITGPAMCGDYEMSNARSTEALATIGAGATASWCLANTGQARVILQGTVAGATVVANLNISITAPKVIEFAAVTDDVHIGLVDSELLEQGALYLTFGGLKSTRKAGIEWTAKLVGSSFTSGSYAFVQLMKISRQKSYNNAALPAMSSSSEDSWVLDEDVFYGTTESTNSLMAQADGEYEDFVTAQWPSESTMIKGDDSPGTPLFSSLPEEHRRFDEIRVEEHFRTYLMYRPKAAGSIWVSIAKLEWHWKAHAKFSKEVSSSKGTWRLISKEFDVNPVGEKCIELPAWTRNRNQIMRN
ncbi:hypothetical protein HSX11_16815 [Oxalobacteraceae bacterium]|nr:hypothetical protein [Oxalobacteraceae bacterium]